MVVNTSPATVAGEGAGQAATADCSCRRDAGSHPRARGRRAQPWSRPCRWTLPGPRRDLHRGHPAVRGGDQQPWGGRIVSFQTKEHMSHEGGMVQLIPCRHSPAGKLDALIFPGGQMALGKANYHFAEPGGSLTLEAGETRTLDPAHRPGRRPAGGKDLHLHGRRVRHAGGPEPGQDRRGPWPGKP